ncbi:MAG: hypothetical protein ACRCTR_01105 [Actinomycetota bacterium]
MHASCPRLIPGLNRAWRDHTTLQFGIPPGPGAVISGLGAGDEALINALDGRHDLSALAAIARFHRLPTERARHLVDVLANAGLLLGKESLTGSASYKTRTYLPTMPAQLLGDAQTWTMVYPDLDDARPIVVDRNNRVVQIDGGGRVANIIASTLGAAEVGYVCSTKTERVESIRLRKTPHRADLVIVIRDDVISPRTTDALMREGIPHLLVVSGSNYVSVGPLVIPGNGPCARCLDLYRTDRDPGWPAIAAQITTQPEEVIPRGEVASATAAAGLICLHAVTWLDGIDLPSTWGRTIDLTLPHGHHQLRRWLPHPRCGCTKKARHGSSRLNS